ncbi:OmpA family protein [Roseicyclus mahoneyensis]|uniref:OOP family OmpA-OmpF porin n=1 Tax=Roseicyclus mahoneyensis TaxID=164332 RepID=A0A316GG44_9RHOB|nr:OmpA family protein [Roseicyclus mahoneyensis]PWK59895.1 OOP family OmpA-OmpF porin [Roseicyclus mahoneyensis]
MIRIQTFIATGSFALAGALAVVTAGFLALAMENRSVETIEQVLHEGGMGWAEVSANGLQVYLDGTAPSEASAFRAASRAGAIIDADRVVNRIEIARRDAATPPRFSVDVLRTPTGIQVIGLVPAETGLDPINAAIAGIANGGDVANLVETADFPVPETWTIALDYGLRALQELPRSKVTVYANRVEVQAISESAEQRARFLATLERGQPQGVTVILDISAPRPVVTPFVLRFAIDAEGARFETCTADTLEARNRIIAAAAAAGAEGLLTCQIGLGVPSPQWADAVISGIRALASLGAGTIAFSDADVTFIAAEGIGQDEFDRVIGELGAALPGVFSLQGILPEQRADGGTVSTGPARFIATLADDGQVRLRGRLPEGPVGRSVEAYARALFGAARTDIATRSVEDLPEGWSVRAMAGLQALSMLHDGTMTLEPDTLLLRGQTGNSEAISDLTRLLTEELGQAAAFDLEVSYEESLDPVASQLTPEQCVARIQEIQAEGKITFDPGSVEINQAAGRVLDRIAQVLPDCRHVRMEISGHTDSQGRDEMNLNLSQSRADAVLNGLLARNVLVSNLVAQGYGETRPIASNETEEGREQNRRIEFRLLAGGTVGADGDATAEDEEVIDETGDGAMTATTRPLPRPASVLEAAAEAETQEDNQ